MPPMKVKLMGGVDISLPNVSYCEDVKDVHYTPYNLVRFYVGEISGTTPQTVSIYTGSSTSVDIEVSEGNKWYSYVLPKDKGLYKIEGNSVKKVTVKADIIYSGSGTIIPESTTEVYFKGSNTSKVTYMSSMFANCSGITSLDLSGLDTSNVTGIGSMFYNCTNLTSLYLSGWDTSKVTNMSSMFYNCTNLTSLDLSGWDTSKVTDMADMSYMFYNCKSLKTITMKNCSLETIKKIQKRLTDDGITAQIITQ